LAFSILFRPFDFPFDLICLLRRITITEIYYNSAGPFSFSQLSISSYAQSVSLSLSAGRFTQLAKPLRGNRWLGRRRSLGRVMSESLPVCQQSASLRSSFSKL
jgi:hypothetical protein